MILCRKVAWAIVGMLTRAIQHRKGGAFSRICIYRFQLEISWEIANAQIHFLASFARIHPYNKL